MPLLSWLWGRALELPFLWTKYINVTVKVNVLSTEVTDPAASARYTKPPLRKLVDCQKEIQPIVLRRSAVEELKSESFPDNTRGECSWKTLLSSPSTASDTFTAGVATCPPKTGSLTLHRHTHAEIYHIISGKGIVAIDGSDYVVGEGDVVFIPGDAEHGVFNTGEDAPLKWFYCFAADSFGDVSYRFKHESVKPDQIAY